MAGERCNDFRCRISCNSNKNNFFWKHPFPKKEKGIVFGVKAREASLIFSKRRVQLDLVVSVSVQLKDEDNCSLSCLSYTSTS